MADVTEDQLSKRIRQLSVFLPNRLGALLTLDRALEAAEIRICALSTVDAADHAVLRLVVDQPTLAKEVLATEGYSLVDTELLGVVLPPGAGIRRVLTAILMAEQNIHYIYPLMAQKDGRQVLAIHPEDAAAAARTLVQRGMQLIDQEDLRRG